MHVGDELAEPLWVAEIQMIDAGGVGVLLHLRQVKLVRRGVSRDAASVAPETASAPRNLRRLMIDISNLLKNYLFTGLSGLMTSATRSLIWSTVSTLLAPKRGMFEQG